MTASIFFMYTKPGVPGPPTMFTLPVSLLRCQPHEQRHRFACGVPSSNDEAPVYPTVARIPRMRTILSKAYGCGAEHTVPNTEDADCRLFAQLEQMQSARFLCRGWGKTIRCNRSS